MIVSHLFAKADTVLLDPIPVEDLYQYVVGENGIFIRATRPEIDVMFWVSSTNTPIRGLSTLAQHIHLDAVKVPARMTARMVELARNACGKEILFYLKVDWMKFSSLSDKTLAARNETPWMLSVPEQYATRGTVTPKNPYGSDGVLIEVHSHYAMAPFFSGQDDNDERGFRIYAVLGNLLAEPMIQVRVSVYGHFFTIPASTVFDLPVGLKDAYLAGALWS